MACSAHSGLGIPEIEELMQDKICLFSGHSGVGKSTLINKLIPDLTLKTSEISAYSDKGVHTTTFSEMYPVNQSTYIIDTPGIKELGLVDIEEDELGGYFPEIRDRKGACKYHNCTHTNEPGCAIVPAVRGGEIAITRYESYLSMLGEDDNRK